MNRLKELRTEKRMKQDDLAQLLHVSRPAISTWEQETREMDTATIRRLCEIFGVTADYLLGLSAQRSHQITDADAALVSAYKRAPDSVRAGIDALLEPYRDKKEAEGL